MKLFLKTIVLTVVMALFAACGSSNFEWFPEANKAPKANAGANQSVFVGDTVSLDGSASSDENGDKLTYSWSFSSRPTDSTAALLGATTVNPTFTADKAGDYVLSLIVNDGTVSSVAATVTVTASTALDLVAHAGSDQLAVILGATVQLDGRSSTDRSGAADVNGTKLTYIWSVTSWPEALSEAPKLDTVTDPSKPTFKVVAAGTYKISLVVQEGNVSSDADEVVVKVATPDANAGSDQTVAIGATVQLNGRDSTDINGVADVNGTKLNYLWTITSWPTGSTKPALDVITDPSKPTFVANSVGTYKISLVVQEGTVSSDADEVVVTVAALRANAGPDQPTVAIGATVQLYGRDSTDLTGTADVNGTKLTYLWEITSWPGSTKPALDVITDPSKPTFKADPGGIYKISLVVKDGTVSSAADEVIVTTTGSITVSW